MRNRRAIPWRYAAVVVPALISLAGGGISTAATPPASVVHTQPYPPGPPAGSANTTTSCDGCAVTTTWTGFKPGSTINLTLFSDAHSLGNATVNAEGVAVKTVTIPADTDPGSHTITGAGLAPDGSPTTASITITVAGATGSGGSGSGGSGSAGSEPGGPEHRESEPQLPHTGADLQVPVGIGAAALTVGALVVFSVRRRKTSDSPDR